MTTQMQNTSKVSVKALCLMTYPYLLPTRWLKRYWMGTLLLPSIPLRESNWNLSKSQTQSSGEWRLQRIPSQIIQILPAMVTQASLLLVEDGNYWNWHWTTRTEEAWRQLHKKPLWGLGDPPPANNFCEQNVPSAANSWARSFWTVWLLKWIWFFHHSPFNFFSSSLDLNLKITRKCKCHFSFMPETELFLQHILTCVFVKKQL